MAKQPRLKILHLAPADFAGVAMELCTAVNAYTDCTARLLTKRRHSLGFKTDIVTTLPHEFARWIGWADVVHNHRLWGILDASTIKPKALVHMYHGSMYRREHDKHNKICKQRGVRKIFVSTPDLTQWGGTWLPTCIPVEDHAALARKMKSRSNAEKPIVCQAPTNFDRKSTKEVARQVKAIPEVSWRCVVKKQHRLALQLKAEALIGVDQFQFGIGRNGLEFFAMNIPVLADVDLWVAERYMDQIGYLPFHRTPVDRVGREVRRLLKNPDLFEETRVRGFDYVMKYHYSPVVAERYIRMLEEVL